MKDDFLWRSVFPSPPLRAQPHVGEDIHPVSHDGEWVLAVPEWWCCAWAAPLSSREQMELYVLPGIYLWTFHFFFLCPNVLTCIIRAVTLFILGVCLSLDNFEFYGRKHSHAVFSLSSSHSRCLGSLPAHYLPLGTLLNRFFLWYFSYVLRNYFVSKKNRRDVWRSGGFISLCFHLPWDFIGMI